VIGTSEQFLRKFEDGMRALAAFNGAGIAGVIALMQRNGPIPWTIRGAGIAFLLGIFGTVAMWIFIGIPEAAKEYEPSNRQMTNLAMALYFSAAAFLVGVLLTFLGA
jgi:hypothetical protein